MDGVININKPGGLTSFDVVAILRKTLNMKKIGHTGTLDPDATGVLPICIGKATKLVEFLTSDEKQYIATVKLGITTDTQDISGNVLEERDVCVSEEDILNASKKFTGKIFQIPPMYSAIKVNGKKLYEIARQGEEIERAPREIEIFDISISDFNNGEKTFKMVVSCSKGTYIRTLANDIGEYLGCGATLKELKRTKSGKYNIEQSYTLNEIKEMYENEDLSFLTPLSDVMDEYDKIFLAERNSWRLVNGIPFDVTGLEEGTFYRLFDEKDIFLAIAEKSKDKMKILKTFFG